VKAREEARKQAEAEKGKNKKLLQQRREEIRKRREEVRSAVHKEREKPQISMCYLYYSMRPLN
jgi:hypothetical protein